MTVLVLGPEQPRGIVLFGAGAGGDPDRYGTVLTALADAGNRVLAPHHVQLIPGTATSDQFVERPRGLKGGPARHGGDEDLPVFAVGHSIGGWASLCLAGAVPRVGHFDFMDALPPGVEPDPALDRTAFLRDPGTSTVTALTR